MTHFPAFKKLKFPLAAKRNNLYICRDKSLYHYGIKQT